VKSVAGALHLALFEQPEKMTFSADSRQAKDMNDDE
jgi:hypothetical protein